MRNAGFGLKSDNWENNSPTMKSSSGTPSLSNSIDRIVCRNVWLESAQMRGLSDSAAHFQRRPALDRVERIPYTARLPVPPVKASSPQPAIPLPAVHVSVGSDSVRGSKIWHFLAHILNVSILPLCTSTFMCINRLCVVHLPSYVSIRSASVRSVDCSHFFISFSSLAFATLFS